MRSQSAGLHRRRREILEFLIVNVVDRQTNRDPGELDRFVRTDVNRAPFGAVASMERQAWLAVRDDQNLAHARELLVVTGFLAPIVVFGRVARDFNEEDRVDNGESVISRMTTAASAAWSSDPPANA